MDKYGSPKCPKCGSMDLDPVGTKVVCKDCKHSF